MGKRRVGVFAALSALALIGLTPSPASAKCYVPPPADPALAAPAEAETNAAQADRAGRVVAPITVNGQGPFRFIVDTGANRTVLSEALAAKLGLVPENPVDVHTVHEVVSAPVVGPQSVKFGALAWPNTALPVMKGPFLAGEAGLLGVDGLAGRRLTVDFDRRCVDIVSADRAGWLLGWVQVQGGLRFDRLVYIPGRVRGVDVKVILDTGANVSLANKALRDALDAAGVRAPSSTQDAVKLYGGGEPVVLDKLAVIPEIDIAGKRVIVTDVPVFIDDFHVFDLWGFRNEPTLLIGMNVLSQMRGVAIDYAKARVFFHVRGGLQTGSRLQAPADSPPLRFAS